MGTLGDDNLKTIFVVQWVVKGAVDVDIGANPSAEGGEDESVDDQAVKVVDIVDTFRLQVRLNHKPLFLSLILENSHFVVETSLIYFWAVNLISENNHFVVRLLFVGTTCFWQEAVSCLY